MKRGEPTPGWYAFRLAGGAGAVLWLAGAAISTNEEIARNRVIGAGLAGICAGLLGASRRAGVALARAERRSLGLAVTGLALMAFGTLTEYWVLAGFRHQGDGVGSFSRGLAWMAVLLGAVCLAAAATVAGVLLLRNRTAPRLLGALLVALAPATVALAVLGPIAAALPLASIGVTTAISQSVTPRRA